MTSTTPIPESSNKSWGLYGSLNEHAEAGWPIAMQAIADATDQPLDSVRAFLDSRHGRHFADEVSNGLTCWASLSRPRSTRSWLNRH
jgi:hypothetical protein